MNIENALAAFVTLVAAIIITFLGSSLALAVDHSDKQATTVCAGVTW